MLSECIAAQDEPHQRVTLNMHGAKTTAAWCSRGGLARLTLPLRAGVPVPDGDDPAVHLRPAVLSGRRCAASVEQALPMPVQAVRTYKATEQQYYTNQY